MLSISKNLQIVDFINGKIYTQLYKGVLISPQSQTQYEPFIIF